jgi:hypothetical protein
MILNSSRQHTENRSHSTDDRLDNSMMAPLLVDYQRVLCPVMVTPSPSRTAFFFDKKTSLFAERQGDCDVLTASKHHSIHEKSMTFYEPSTVSPP